MQCSPFWVVYMQPYAKQQMQKTKKLCYKDPALKWSSSAHNAPSDRAPGAGRTSCSQLGFGCKSLSDLVGNGMLLSSKVAHDLRPKFGSYWLLGLLLFAQPKCPFSEIAVLSVHHILLSVMALGRLDRAWLCKYDDASRPDLTPNHFPALQFRLWAFWHLC